MPEASIDIGIARQHFGQRDCLLGASAPIDAQQSNVGLVHLEPRCDATFAPFATTLHPEQLDLSKSGVRGEGLRNGRAALIPDLILIKIQLHQAAGR